MLGIWIAVNFGRAEVGEPSLMPGGKLQHIPCASDRHFERLQRIGPVIKRTRNAGCMKDVIHSTIPRDWLNDVLLNEPDIRPPLQVSTRLARSQQIIEPDKGA